MVLRLPLFTFVIAARPDAAIGKDAPIPFAVFAIELTGLDPGERALELVEVAGVVAEPIQPPQTRQRFGLDPPHLLQLAGRAARHALFEIAALLTVEPEL